MSKTVLAVVEFPTIGGTPLDASHNSFVFHSEAAVAADDVSTEVSEAVQDFYTATPTGGTHPLGVYIAPSISRAANSALTRWYDISAHLDGSSHGSPYRIDTWTLPNAVADVGLPEGCSLCISYHSAYGMDPEFGAPAAIPTEDQAVDEGAPATHTGISRLRQRDRGRIYLGPLVDLSIQTDPTTKRASVGDALVDNAWRAAKDLADGVSFPGITDAFWAIWSRRNSLVAKIVAGWLDDRFDYQRRREDQGIKRTSWTA